MLSLQLATHLLYRPTIRIILPLSNKRLLVKGESHIRPTGVQTPDTERVSAQSGQKEKEKRGPRKGRCGMSQGTMI
jgi:hypothetical protein